jgi:oligopeptide transport system substrate-binding protein
LREALSLSLNFENFKKIFHAKGRPGCPSLPSIILKNPKCLDFDLAKAKKAYGKAHWPKGVKKELGFSQMGGDDIARAAEWFQGQWKSHLGFLLDLRPQEQTIYLRNLRVAPPAVFRKGIGLDRPTCLAALEIFSKDHPENFIHLDNAEYEKIIAQLRSTDDAKKKDSLCRRGIDILLDSHWIVPLGQIHFTMLARPQFTGWQVNALNQLDLSRLRASKP